VFTIRCEQFVIGRAEDPPLGPDGKPMSILRLSNFTPVPSMGPDGKPMMFQIGTMMVEIVLDTAERAQLIATLEADTLDEAAQLLDEGEPQPLGVVPYRCPRLQRHPSHVWELGAPTDVAWCDGLVWEDGDALPDATDAQEALEAGYASEADAIAEAEEQHGEAEAHAAAEAFWRGDGPEE